MAIANFPGHSKATWYNIYDLEPTGVTGNDTSAWVALVNAINANVPAGKSCKVRIRDNGQSLKLSTTVDLDGSQALLRGCHIFGETKNSRIEFDNEYQINWGGYTNPTDLSATMPSYVTRGTMGADMPARTGRLLNPSGVSLSRGDWVLVWSKVNHAVSVVAPHISSANAWPITVTATGGTYTVTINSNTSSSISYNAPIATIKAALEGISGVGSGNVDVTGTSSSYTITMMGTLAVSTNTISLGVGSLTGGTATVGTDQRGYQRAAEFHRVEYATGSDFVLAGFVVDDMLGTGTIGVDYVGPGIAKVEMLRNCGFSNLTLGCADSTNSSTNAPSVGALSVQRCLGFVMEDVEVDETGAGSAGFQMCSNGQINNFSGTYQLNNHKTYGVLFQVVNNMIYQDSVWHNTRHMLTNGGMQAATDNIRYGTARNCVGRNLDMHIPGDPYGNGWGGFDLHAEAWGFTLDRCRVFAATYYTPSGGEESVHGFSTRARATRFLRCEHISGATQSKPAGGSYYTSWYKNVDGGFRIMANDCMIEDCLVDGAWKGVWVREEITSPEFRPQNTTVKGCTFKGISGPVLWATASGINGIRFMENDCIDCSGYYTYGGTYNMPGTMLIVQTGTGHQVRNNYMDKGNNEVCLWAGSLTTSNLEFSQNYVRGYTAYYGSGSNKIGVRGDTGDPRIATFVEATAASFQSTYSAQNFTT